MYSERSSTSLSKIYGSITLTNRSPWIAKLNVLQHTCYKYTTLAKLRQIKYFSTPAVVSVRQRMPNIQILLRTHWKRLLTFSQRIWKSHERSQHAGLRDWSIFIRGLGPVQKVIGHLLFLDKIINELELFSTSAIIG